MQQLQYALGNLSSNLLTKINTIMYHKLSLPKDKQTKLFCTRWLCKLQQNTKGNIFQQITKDMDETR